MEKLNIFNVRINSEHPEKWRNKKPLAALLWEIYGLPTTAVTTEPLGGVESVTGAVPCTILAREIHEQGSR
jgi:hypothetical protein